jgi:hypothetical protein
MHTVDVMSVQQCITLRLFNQRIGCGQAMPCGFVEAWYVKQQNEKLVQGYYSLVLEPATQRVIQVIPR